jgi:glycosyltransferase involved in cell wall biosynthesis
VRILYFSRDYSTHDRRFLAAIADGGHDVYYLRLENSSRSLERRPLPVGVQAVDWAGGRPRARIQDYPRLLLSLRKVLQRVQPDLVHAGPVQSAALLAALSGFQPLVTMSWGSDMLLESSRNSYMRWATAYVLRRSTLLLADCMAVRDRALEFGFPISRIMVFPWGVDLDHFSPNQDDGILRRSVGWGQEFVVLHTRSWEPLYGVDLLARAFISAAEHRQDIKLLMLGNGSMAGELRRAFSDARLEDRVVFPGQVGYDELPSYYHSADLYVSASHSDGSSVSLLEAMACGLPAVVSDIPGNQEWVVPGENGWHFPDGDARALSRRLLDVAARRSQLAAMGRTARHTAELRADWHRHKDTLFAAYEMALARS